MRKLFKKGRVSLHWHMALECFLVCSLMIALEMIAHWLEFLTAFWLILGHALLLRLLLRIDLRAGTEKIFICLAIFLKKLILSNYRPEFDWSCITLLSVESAIKAVILIYVWLSTTHWAKFYGALPQIFFEVLNVGSVVRHHLVRFWVKARHLSSSLLVGEVDNTDLLSFVLRADHRHIVKGDKPALVGSGHSLEDRVLDRCLSHVKRWHSLLGSARFVGLRSCSSA